MGNHPLNLGIRFLLELVVLVVYGMWGYHLVDTWPRVAFAILFPLIAAILWGVFAVPEDPSRSGKAPVPTPGFIRLIMELIFFVAGILAFYDLGYKTAGLLLCVITTIHYALSYDRIKWLLSK